MRLQVRLRRAHVEPVAGKRDPEDRAFIGQPRKDLPLDRDGTIRRNELEHVRLEDIEPGVDEIGVDLLGSRLLEEGLDAAVRSRANEAVTARVGDGGQQDRRPRAGRAMERDHLAEICLAERVTVEREEASVELAPGESNRTARPQRLALDPVLERHAAMAIAERRLDLVGEVAARDDRAVDTVPREMLERIREKRTVDERQHVLARAVGERSKPRALPAHEDDRGKCHETGRPMPS